VSPPYREPANARTLIIPDGWSVARLDGRTEVLHRHAALPWPAGRVSATTGTIRVTADRTAADGVGETVRYTGSGDVVLADLLWPGWHAKVDGYRVRVGRSYAGLVRITLPAARPGGSTVRLTFSPPGWRIGGAMAALGLLGGAAYCLMWSLRRRRRRRADGAAQSPPPSGAVPTTDQPAGV
jgi:hypothetical protein